MGEVDSAAPPRDFGTLELIHWNALLITGALFISLVAITTFVKAEGLSNPWVSITLLVLAFASLITAADFFVEGAKGIARKAGIAEVVIGLTIVSIGTSLPEILVSVSASWGAGGADPELANFAVGNIYGSILVQISLILGLVVLFKPLDIRPAWIRRDGLLMLGGVLAMTLLLWTGKTLERWEGILLTGSYIFYIYWLLKHREQIRIDEMAVIDEITSKDVGWTQGAYLVMIITGLSFAVYASTQLVEVAVDIALSMNVPHEVVGTTLSAFGTSIPELVVAIMAARRSQGVAIGTLIGSNITDPMLSIGLAAIVNPIALTGGGGLIFNVIAPATILGVGFALVFMFTKFKFNRQEGIAMCTFYALFILLLESIRLGWILPWW